MGNNGYNNIKLSPVKVWKLLGTMGRMHMKGRMGMFKTIRLTPDEVQHFVNVTSKCDFDVDICYNRYVVDAKSFLGVFGLDLGRPLTVSYDGYNSEFEEMLRKYAIAC